MSRPLRSILVHGPAYGDGFLWTYDADLHLKKPNGLVHNDLVAHTPTIRGLGVRDKIGTLADDQTRFRDPPLLRGRLDVIDPVYTELKGPTVSDAMFHVVTKKARGATDAEVLLAPSEKWPAGRDGDITVPDMRLVGGRISLRVPYRTESGDPAGIARFLHYHRSNHTIFEGYALVDDEAETGNGPLVHLVPEGIEVDVKLPHPLADVVPDVGAELPVRVRIEPDGTGFIARLIAVLGPNAPTIPALWQAAFNTLEAKGAPLRAETDTRAAVPPFSWVLSVNHTGLHLRDLDSTVKWRIRVDPAILTLRLVTDTPFGAERPAVARLIDLPPPVTTALLLERGSGDAPTTLRYTAAAAAGDAPPKVTATYDKGGAYELEALISSELDTALPYEAAAARRAMPADVPDWAFLPVTGGTLQLRPKPPEDSAALATAIPPDPPQSSLAGRCAFRRGEGNGDDGVLEIDGARDVGVTVAWKNQAAGNITLEFGAPHGALREAVWSAEEAPRPDRLLPTGRTDPATLRELPARFGPDIAGNARLSLDAVSSAWTLTFTDALDAILWEAIDTLPLIAAAPILSTNSESQPSDLRPVLPVELSGPIALKGLDNALLPSVEATPSTAPSLFAWPAVETGELAWGAPAISHVSPTAPGIDYAWPAGSAPNGTAFPASLRYDLPILDELFAQPDPEAEAADAPDDPPPAVATTGTLDPGALSLFWRQQAERLATTRTQGARATRWDTPGTELPGPLQLAAPYDADAKITIVADYALGTQGPLPLGGYIWAWDVGDPIAFSGEAALLGPMGEDDAALKLELSANGKLIPEGIVALANQQGSAPSDGDVFRSDAPVKFNVPKLRAKLAGLTADAYTDSDLGGALSDTRGTAMADAARAHKEVKRTSIFRDQAGMKTARRLITLAKPMEVAGFDAKAFFWARDLPLKDATFAADDHPIEGRLGPDPKPFETPVLQEALYEWRLFEEPCTDAPASYSLRRGPLALTPLRLLEWCDGGMRVLCRAALDLAPSAEAEPVPEAFGEERPYAVGPLVELILKRQEQTLDLQSEAYARMLTPETGVDLKLAARAEVQTLDFTLTPVLSASIAGSDPANLGRIGITVSAQLGDITSESPLMGITLKVTLFGSDLALTMTSGEQQGGLQFSYANAETPEGDTVWIATAALKQVAPGPAGWELNLTLMARAWLALETALCLDTTDGALRWLGYQDNDAPDSVFVDAACGAVWLRSEATGGTAEPIKGIVLTDVKRWSLSAGLVLGAGAAADKPIWPIQTGLVQGAIEGKTLGGSVALRSHTQWENRQSHSDLYLTREALEEPVEGKDPALRFQDSGINWDPSGLDIINARKPKDAASFTTEKSAPYTHRISVSLEDCPIPPSALATPAADHPPVFAASVPLILQVRHALIKDNASVLEWRTVDDVVLTTESLWKADWPDEAKTFGPQWKGSQTKYRGENSQGPARAGIGDRSEMLAGFDDPLFLKYLEEDDRLILLGGGVSFWLQDEKAVGFGLPWATGLDTGAEAQIGLPDRFKGLMAFDEKRDWRAASEDVLAFKPGADALPPQVALPTTVLGAPQLEAFLATVPGTPAADGLVLPTSQAYFELHPANTPAGDIKTWPFFLPALVGLKDVLDDLVTPWSVVSVRHRAKASALALRCSPDALAVAPSPMAQSQSLQFVALDPDDGLSYRPLQIDTETRDVQTAFNRLGPARLADLARAQVAGAIAAGLVARGPDGTVHDALAVPLGPETQPFGRVQDGLFNPLFQVPPSPALGWPESPGNAKPERYPMQGQSDVPVISSKAGLAARSAVLATGAAISKGSDARYLGTQARAVFDHGAGYDDVTVRGPAARHLSLLPPRLRTPVPEAREAALRALQGDADEQADAREGAALPLLENSLGLVPPIHMRSFVGERPGIAQTHIDALITDGPRDRPLDRGDRGFGRSAMLAPVLARQMRTPRSPALPQDPGYDPTTRRRTYVSAQDREMADGTGPALPMAVRAHAAALWRLDETDRFILELLAPSLDPDAVALAQGDGVPFSLPLRLSHRGTHEIMPALAKTGFLRKNTGTLGAWLALPDARLDAYRLTWVAPRTVAGDTILDLTLLFAGAELGVLRSALAEPDPNQPARLHLSFNAGGDSGDSFDPNAGQTALNGTQSALRPGIPTAIDFPIGRRPAQRPSLEIAHTSFLFGDSAYDRALASPALSSPILRAMIDGKETPLILAADRTEYDLSQMLYLAFGQVEAGAFAETNSLTGSLALKLLPKRDDPALQGAVPLCIAGLEIGDLAETEIYGLPLSRLEPERAGDPRPQAGDRLSIEVTLTGSVDAPPLVLEVPLADHVEDPRPAAVYSVVALGPEPNPENEETEPRRVRTLLHAAAPAPDRVEFVDLISGLASGHVEKRAIFEWRVTDFAGTRLWTDFTVTKTDRSGGAQLPGKEGDLIRLPDEQV